MQQLPSPNTQGTFPPAVAALLPTDWPRDLPLARITTCGLLSIEVLHQHHGDNGQTTWVYVPLKADLLARTGNPTALLLLSLLASQPRCFATIDFLSEKLRHLYQEDEEREEEQEGFKRVDNVVSRLRHLLCPLALDALPQAKNLRRWLVSYHRGSAESGAGYQLAGLPLVWLDVEAIRTRLKHARTLEQFGQDSLAQWQAAYELAAHGRFLGQEPYSDWANSRRQEVEEAWWDCTQVLWQRYSEQGETGTAEAVRILGEYWRAHPTNEDAVRPLLEALAKREHFGQAEEYYAQVCNVLAEEGKEPDRRTQDVIAFVRAMQIQRKSVPHVRTLPLSSHGDKPVEGASHSSPLLSIWHVPYGRNPFFIGRDALLEQLHNRFMRSTQGASPSAQALCGMGGIGKTQLALEYTYRYAHEYQTVLWMKADTEENLLSDVLTVATILDLPEREARDQQMIVSAVQRWFREHDGWLLIVDNADELTVVPSFLPPGTNGHILLTTQAHALRGLAHRLEVTSLPLEVSASFLLHRAGLLAPGASLEQAAPHDREMAYALARELGGLPLALDQCAAYSEETGGNLSDYLALYQTRRTALLERRGGMGSEHPNAVTTTIKLSLQKVEQNNPAAADLLRLCAFLHPDAIGEELLTGSASILGSTLEPAVSDLLRLNAALGDLLKFSLIQRDSATKTLSLHRLAQIVVKESMDEQTQCMWAERTVKAVNSVFPNPRFTSSWQQCQRSLPHASACAEIIKQYHLHFPEAIQLLNRTSYYLRRRRMYKEAATFCQQAALLGEQYAAIPQSNMADALYHMADLQYFLGNFADAEKHCRQALAIREQLFGKQHLSVAQCLHLLALIYTERIKLQKKDTAEETLLAQQAEQWYLRALSLREEHLGGEDSDVAEVLNNLGSLYLSQGRFVEAEKHLQRSLVIREQIGEKHESILSLYFLALLKMHQRQNTDAGLLLQRGLQMYEQVFEGEHPYHAAYLGSLADIFARQRKYQEAEEHYLKTIKIDEEFLGTEHPHLVPVLEKYASLLHAMQRHTEASRIETRATAIRAQASRATDEVTSSP